MGLGDQHVYPESLRNSCAPDLSQVGVVAVDDGTISSRKQTHQVLTRSQRKSCSPTRLLVTDSLALAAR